MRRSGAVHFASSAGGHLDLLGRGRDAAGRRRRVWITQPSDRARALTVEGEEVELVAANDRRPLRALATAAQSARHLIRDRPRLVVTSGSGLIVPYCLMARALGARLIFCETTARARTPSASGRILHRIADVVLVQWPGMRDVYPGAQVCRPPVLDALTPGPAPQTGGTFVMVGTHVQPFDRLLELADRAAGEGVLPAPVVMQTGASRFVPLHAEAHRFMAPEAVDAEFARARVAICHAGTGSLTTALHAGRRPLILARTAAHDEHLDDHQAELAHELAALDLVVPLDEAIGPEHVAAALRPLERPASAALPTVREALASEIDRLAPVATRRPTLTEGGCR